MGHKKSKTFSARIIMPYKILKHNLTFKNRCNVFIYMVFPNNTLEIMLFCLAAGSHINSHDNLYIFVFFYMPPHLTDPVQLEKCCRSYTV